MPRYANAYGWVFSSFDVKCHIGNTLLLLPHHCIRCSVNVQEEFTHLIKSLRYSQLLWDRV